MHPSTCTPEARNERFSFDLFGHVLVAFPIANHVLVAFPIANHVLVVTSIANTC
jgi:hypothetical protein